MTWLDDMSVSANYIKARAGRSDEIKARERWTGTHRGTAVRVITLSNCERMTASNHGPWSSFGQGTKKGTTIYSNVETFSHKTVMLQTISPSASFKRWHDTHPTNDTSRNPSMSLRTQPPRGPAGTIPASSPVLVREQGCARWFSKHEQILTRTHSLARTAVRRKRPSPPPSLPFPDTILTQSALFSFLLTSLDSVAAFAATLVDRYQVDMLFNNAGFVTVPHTPVNEYGLEHAFTSMHLGPFLLTERLLAARPRLRVINASSGTHHMCAIPWALPPALRRWIVAGYGPGCVDEDYLTDGVREETSAGAYFQAKAANVLHAVELPRRHPDATAAALDLGWVGTAIQPWMRGSVVSVALVCTRADRLSIRS